MRVAAVLYLRSPGDTRLNISVSVDDDITPQEAGIAVSLLRKAMERRGWTYLGSDQPEAETWRSLEGEVMAGNRRNWRNLLPWNKRATRRSIQRTVDLINALEVGDKKKGKRDER